MLAHVRREKSLARRIEKDRGAMLDQRTNLIEFWLGEPRGRDWMLSHIRRSAPAFACFVRRIAEFAVSGAPPPALSNAPRRSRTPHRWLVPTASGIAPVPR